MSLVVSFHDFTPTARYDAVHWAQIKIEEAPDPVAGPWTIIDTLTISPVDADPSLPATRSFTTANGTAADLWYRITFLDGVGGSTEPTAPQQNIILTGYANPPDLFRILKVRDPSEGQVIAAERLLATATLEINAEIDLAADEPPLQGSELALAVSVCLDRAADLWRHTESQPGILGVVDEAVPSSFGRYSWERYAQRLAPAKARWGIA